MREGWATEYEAPPAPQDPDLVEAPAVLARFKRALNASLASLIVLALCFWAQVEGLVSTQALSIRPQDPASLIGILTAPLMHGSLGHLGANAFAVLALGTLAGTVFPKATWRSLPIIWIGSGLGTWLIGTGGAHIGASGVTHGLGFLVFALGVLRRDRAAVAAAMIAFLFFGGMLMTIFPHEIGVSWEYHLAGAASGLLGAVLFRRADPAPPRPRYSWEDEPEEDEDEDASTLEPPSPRDVPVIWQRPPLRVRPVVVPIRRRPASNDESVN